MLGHLRGLGLLRSVRHLLGEGRGAGGLGWMLLVQLSLRWRLRSPNLQLLGWISAFPVAILLGFVAAGGLRIVERSRCSVVAESTRRRLEIRTLSESWRAKLGSLWVIIVVVGMVCCGIMRNGGVLILYAHCGIRLPAEGLLRLHTLSLLLREVVTSLWEVLLHVALAVLVTETSLLFAFSFGRFRWLRSRNLF